MQQPHTPTKPITGSANEPKYTSEQIAELAEISTKTLSRWLRQGLIQPPAKQKLYRHLWSEENLQNVRTYMEAKIRR